MDLEKEMYHWLNRGYHLARLLADQARTPNDYNKWCKEKAEWDEAMVRYQQAQAKKGAVK